MSSEQGNIVKLDIGGTVFKTLRSTLTKFDGFFKTMLETDIPIAKNESGEIFIDRDPKYFLLILNFIRDGRVKLPESKADIEELCVEAEYYLLTGLVELCNANATSDVIKLNVGGTVFQTTKTTLKRKDGLLNRLMNNESQIVRDNSGCIFIDRDPKHFRLILNFMRDGRMKLPESKSDVQEIQIEAQYYLLDGLVKLCAAKLSEQLPIIESDEHLLNLIVSSEKTGKPVVVIYYQIDGNNSAFKMPEIRVGDLRQKYKDKFDIWLKPSNDDAKGGSKYRIFSTGYSLFGMHDCLDGICEALYNYGKRDKYGYLYDDDYY